jgi:hypothetical protein
MTVAISNLPLAMHYRLAIMKVILWLIVNC